MAMKTILLLIHHDEGQESRLLAALDIARAVRAHVRCLDVSVLPAIVSAYDGGIGEAQLLNIEQEREARNKRRLEARMAREDISWDWVDVSGQLPSVILDASKLCDLIVVSGKLGAFPAPDMLHIVSQIIVTSRVPVLAVPSGCSGFRVAGHAMIAWNGSGAAIAAMRSALPLLRLATKVTLREIDDGTVELCGEEAAAWLSREGVHADVSRELFFSRGVADLLCAEARGYRTDYIVLGGYGHSRLREALFGGITRRLLSESAVPLFIGHANP